MLHIGFGVGVITKDMIPKKPYARPALTKWGKLIDLTTTDSATLEGDLKMGTLNVDFLVGRRSTLNRLVREVMDLPPGARRYFRLKAQIDTYGLRRLPKRGGLVA